MATAAALMPLMAQSFVQGDHCTSVNGVAFDMIQNSNASTASSSTTSSPSFHKAKTPPRRYQEKSPARSDGPFGYGVASSSGSNDIFSLTDTVLASRFQFVEEIGYGNWGSVWLVRPKEDPNPEAKLAIKLVHRSKSPTSSARVRSLWTEFKSIRSLKPAGPHPNLIAFHQFIITSSYALVVMDYHPRLMPVELSEEKGRGYFQGLIKGVEWLHLSGITHNDIKPANVMLSKDDQPVLVDFGFAQTYPDPNSSTQLNTPPKVPNPGAPRFYSSLSWGTPEYLSPEVSFQFHLQVRWNFTNIVSLQRARGDMHDERLSDIFALGATMYEVVVGRTPFEENETEEFLTRDALTVYYHRSTTGRFYGKVNVSNEFATLIHSMIEPSVHLRLLSCGKALSSRFFDPQSGALKKQISYNSSVVSTPIRTSSLPVIPSSSARKRRVVPNASGAKSIKVYEDSPTSVRSSIISPARSSPHRSPQVLTEKTSFINISTSPLTAMRAKATKSPVTYKSPTAPSRIPVRKVDINSPAPTRHMSPKKAAASPRVKVPAKLSLSAAAMSPSANKRTFAEQDLNQGDGAEERKMSMKERRNTSPPKTSPPKATSEECEDETEVLSSAKKSRFSFNARPLLSRSSPTSPLESAFANVAPKFKRSRSVTQPQQDLQLARALEKHKSEVDLTSYNRTSPLRPNSFASKLRKLSLRRAPSSLSFRAIKSSISHVAKRRNSTSSEFSLLEPEPVKNDDHKSMTMPISFSHSKFETKRSEPIGTERARLESFSRHIQNIIDAHKPVDQPLPKRSLAAKASRAAGHVAVSEMAILTPSEVQEFTQQVVQELEEEQRQKSVSQEEMGPRTRRSGSLSRASNHSPLAQPPMERIQVKIRPSLTPSFVGTSAAPAERTPSSSIASTTSSFSCAAATEFRPGHRRIPTAIRTVPSILLTESADDESSSEFDRAETPSSERVLSPPPTERIVEAGRQLPTWVPEDLSSEGEDEGDVDEPTITINSSPSKLKKKPSRVGYATASATGLYHQFVKATPGIDRRGHRTPASSPYGPTTHFATSPLTQREPERVASPSQDRTDSRCSLRATNQSGLSRKRSVASFFFSKSSNRAPTPSPSLSSMSSFNLSEAESSASKASRFKKVMRKLMRKE